MSEEVKKIHNLAVKQAAEAYLDLWLEVDHVETPPELLTSTLNTIYEMEINS